MALPDHLSMLSNPAFRSDMSDLFLAISGQSVNQGWACAPARVCATKRVLVGWHVLGQNEVYTLFKLTKISSAFPNQRW